MHFKTVILFAAFLQVHSRSLETGGGGEDLLFHEDMDPQVVVRDAWVVDSPVVMHDEYEDCPKGFRQDAAGKCREVFFEDYIYMY